MEPRSIRELSCVLDRLIDQGVFDGVGPRQVLHQAVQEIGRTILQSVVDGTEPSACERLVGALFVDAVEHFVTPDQIVTIEETDSEQV